MTTFAVERASALEVKVRIIVTIAVGRPEEEAGRVEEELPVVDSATVLPMVVVLMAGEDRIVVAVEGEAHHLPIVEDIVVGDATKTSSSKHRSTQRVEILV